MYEYMQLQNNMHLDPGPLFVYLERDDHEHDKHYDVVHTNKQARICCWVQQEWGKQWEVSKQS